MKNAVYIEEIDRWACSEEAQITENLIDKSGSETKYFMEGVAVQAEIKNGNTRLYKLEPSIRECAEYQAKIQEGRAVGELNHPHCFSPSAKILTPNGWKFFKDVVIDENVFTLNPKTNEIELQPIKQIINEEYKGKMIRIKGRNIDTLVTPKHRFIITNRYGKNYFITAEEILNDVNIAKHSHSYIPKTGVWNGEINDDFVIEKNGEIFKIPMMLFMKFLGIYIADGHCSRAGDKSIVITQAKKNTIEIIKNMLNEFPDEYKWDYYEETNKAGYTRVRFILNNSLLHAYLLKLGYSHERYIPSELKKLSSIFLEGFIYFYNIGDGRDTARYGYKYPQLNVFSTSEKLIDDVHEILFKCGKCGTRWVDDYTDGSYDDEYIFADHVINIKNKKNLHGLNFSKTKGIYLDYRFLEVTEEDYDDRIHCVTVDNSTIYVMDNNKVFWSGNCPDINPERVVLKILEYDRINESNDFRHKSEVLPYGLGIIVRGHMDHGIQMATSSRALGKLKKTRDMIIVEDYKLVTPADIVWNNSAPDAIPTYIKEDLVLQIYDNVNLMEDFYSIQIEESISKLHKAPKYAIKDIINNVYNEIMNLKF